MNTGLVALHIRGGDAAVGAVDAILQRLHLRALDAQTGNFFKAGPESIDSFRKWRAYRDQCLKTKNKGRVVGDYTHCRQSGPRGFRSTLGRAGQGLLAQRGSSAESMFRSSAHSVSPRRYRKIGRHTQGHCPVRTLCRSPSHPSSPSTLPGIHPCSRMCNLPILGGLDTLIRAASPR
jgi:hypothetical protein